MSREAIREYFKSIHIHYQKASKELKQLILNEFCATTGYNRKYAIRKLNGPLGKEAVNTTNDLYRHELRLFMNLFLFSMKLPRKKGSRLTRVYDQPKTPPQRVVESRQGDPEKIETLKKLKDSISPFSLAQIIETKLERIYKLADHRQSPNMVQSEQSFQKPLSKVERETIAALSRIFPGPSL